MPSNLMSQLEFLILSLPTRKPTRDLISFQACTTHILPHLHLSCMNSPKSMVCMSLLVLCGFELFQGHQAIVCSVHLLFENQIKKETIWSIWLQISILQASFSTIPILVILVILSAMFSHMIT